MNIPNITFEKEVDKNNDKNVEKKWYITEMELSIKLSKPVFIFQFPENTNIFLNGVWFYLTIFDFFKPLYMTPELFKQLEIFTNGENVTKITVWVIEINKNLPGYINYGKLNIDYSMNKAFYGNNVDNNIYELLYECDNKKYKSFIHMDDL